MTNFVVDYTYKIEADGSYTVTADDADQADDLTREYVRETFPDAYGVEIEDVKEINK
jgi:hypothetical protein